jgi:hypothetical protein
VKGDGGTQIYGKLPIVPHTNIDLWKFNQGIRQWRKIDTIRFTTNIENMINT